MGCNKKFITQKYNTADVEKAPAIKTGLHFIQTLTVEGQEKCKTAQGYL